MENEKKIIIDIDNTLWDLSPELWSHLRKINPNMPPPSQWNRWESWEGHIPLKNLMQALRTIHMNQERYPPYPESQFFLNALKERDFYIIIASHRHKETLDPTVRWLNKHGLFSTKSISAMTNPCCSITARGS
jgi:FMN phosphatase YigB (HAD superfamily)